MNNFFDVNSDFFLSNKHPYLLELNSRTGERCQVITGAASSLVTQSVTVGRLGTTLDHAEIVVPKFYTGILLHSAARKPEFFLSIVNIVHMDLQTPQVNNGY